MKGFASTAFFRVFDRAIRPSDPLKGEERWTVDGVAWRHERHSYKGPEHQFAIDVFTGTRPGKKGWTVMVVTEGWWAPGRTDPVRAHQWARLMSGSRTEALAWFQAQDPSPALGLSRRPAR